MIRQTGKRLDTSNIINPVIQQIHHFCGQEPAFAHLIAHGDQAACLLGQSVNILTAFGQTCFFQRRLDRLAVNFQVGNQHWIKEAQLSAFAELLGLVNRIVDAIEYEIQEIRHNRLAPLGLNHLYDVVVGVGMELDQDFSDNPHLWLHGLDHRKLNEFGDDFAGQPFVFPE
ncbi:hypothetical protein D3C73_553370 [compost metagenome]